MQPQYATPTRPAYDAPGGHLRYDTLSGTAFDWSPCVGRSSFSSAGLAIARVFAESSERIEASY